MASGLVDAVVGKIGGMIIDEMTKEVSLVLNFREDFEWLREKLRSIIGYLRDADAQSAHNDNVKSWLLDVAEIAWDAEDILDECALQSRGRIKDVKDRMKSIMEKGAELKLVMDLIHQQQPSTSRSGNVNLRGLSLIESGSRPVAIEPKVEQVIHLIDDLASPVIAVVGMGGAGKTFLMQNVFNRIKDKFEKSIWLSVSQTYSLRKLQADLASEIKNLDEVVHGKVSEVQAAKLIHESLARKRCLVVLDDVWRATGEDDLIYALGLPRGDDTQCKIVVTTRSRNVCDDMNARVYEIQLLSQEESWELFCAFAFPDCHQNQPPKPFEGIAREIERECGRLPLAVKMVAASLKGKRLSSDWQSKLQYMKEASSSNDPIMQILKLSYDSLPAHLKPCFAFLSFFPEDEDIHSEYLINLWVAEGYIPQGEHHLDIGWSYVCQLHSLCLVERQDFDYANPYYCTKLDTTYKLHDLVLDLAISISKESNCAFSVEEAFKKGPARVLMVKKTVGDGDVDVMASNRAYSASRLRTLSFSQSKGIENIPATLLSGARVVRILDLSGTSITSLPACVENLKLLRFLNLSWTNITEVPECVRGNKSLRFLDISGCRSLKRMPNWIGELNCLEHLDIRGFTEFMPKGISKLVSLRVLRTDALSLGIYKLAVENNEFLKLEHFVNLVNLHEVRIDINHAAELKSIEDGCLDMLVKMRILTIQNKVECGYNPPLLPEKIIAMKDLEFLLLNNFAMPSWICVFSNLMKLNLREIHCAEYPALETLPNLISLMLMKNRNCKALPEGFWKPGEFPQLCFFLISTFDQLKELSEIEEGAMPRLETLRVRVCPNLKRVPVGLERLKSLKDCTFVETGVTHFFKEDGELWNKMKASNPDLIIETDE